MPHMERVEQFPFPVTIYYTMKATASLFKVVSLLITRLKKVGVSSYKIQPFLTIK